MICAREARIWPGVSHRETLTHRSTSKLRRPLKGKSMGVEEERALLGEKKGRQALESWRAKVLLLQAGQGRACPRDADHGRFFETEESRSTGYKG